MRLKRGHTANTIGIPKLMEKRTTSIQHGSFGLQNLLTREFGLGEHSGQEFWYRTFVVRHTFALLLDCAMYV